MSAPEHELCGCGQDKAKYVFTSTADAGSLGNINVNSGVCVTCAYKLKTILSSRTTQEIIAALDVDRILALTGKPALSATRLEQLRALMDGLEIENQQILLEKPPEWFKAIGVRIANAARLGAPFIATLGAATPGQEGAV